MKIFHDYEALDQWEHSNVGARPMKAWIYLSGDDEEPHPVCGGECQSCWLDLQTPAGSDQEELPGLLRVSGQSCDGDDDGGDNDDDDYDDESKLFHTALSLNIILLQICKAGIWMMFFSFSLPIVIFF